MLFDKEKVNRQIGTDEEARIREQTETHEQTGTGEQIKTDQNM